MFHINFFKSGIHAFINRKQCYYHACQCTTGGGTGALQAPWAPDAAGGSGAEPKPST